MFAWLAQRSEEGANFSGEGARLLPDQAEQSPNLDTLAPRLREPGGHVLELEREVCLASKDLHAAEQGSYPGQSGRTEKLELQKWGNSGLAIQPTETRAQNGLKYLRNCGLHCRNQYQELRKPPANALIFAEHGKAGGSKGLVGWGTRIHDH